MRADGRNHCAEASAPAGSALSWGSRRQGGTRAALGPCGGTRAAPGHPPRAPFLKVLWGSLGGSCTPIAQRRDPSNTDVKLRLFPPLTETTFDQFPNRYFTSSGCLPALFALIVGGSKCFLGVRLYTCGLSFSHSTHRPAVFPSVLTVCTSCCTILLYRTFLLRSCKIAPSLSLSPCLYLLNFSTWGNADFISFLGVSKE